MAALLASIASDAVAPSVTTASVMYAMSGTTVTLPLPLTVMSARAAAVQVKRARAAIRAARTFAPKICHMIHLLQTVAPSRGGLRGSRDGPRTGRVRPPVKSSTAIGRCLAPDLGGGDGAARRAAAQSGYQATGASCKPVTTRTPFSSV